ncbi:hypothetical protein [Prevotella heparinolytica]|uniref:hypothetical protein n=1 Tax=Prevotella heparinolytica TaxID=28113 RepID=UPI0013EFB813|nr:hypothetical protein [Bacteroides heparinolyticus]
MQARTAVIIGIYPSAQTEFLERRDIRTDEEAGIGKNQLTRADSRDEAYVEQNSKRQ